MEWLHWEMPIWLVIIFFAVFFIVSAFAIELVGVRWTCGFWPKWSMIFSALLKKNKKAAG